MPLLRLLSHINFSYINIMLCFMPYLNSTVIKNWKDYI